MSQPPIARIYRPTKNAMQSGKRNTRGWKLEFEPVERYIEPLMGWTASTSTLHQIELSFPTMEEAVAYATRNQIAYQVIEPQQATPQRRLYPDNFRFDRIEAWSLPKRSEGGKIATRVTKS